MSHNTPALTDSDSKNETEMSEVIAKSNDLEEGASKAKKQILMTSIDERFNVKREMRIWGPRLDFVVRLMLVATFIDDSFRMFTNFTDHTKEVEQFLGHGIATVALGSGLLAQFFGSCCLLSLIHIDIATKVLIGWVIVQPMLYAQLSNYGFVAESLAVLGGLLLLRAHLVYEQSNDSAHIQLLGRLLIPPMYLHYAVLYLSSMMKLDETTGLFNYVSSLSIFFLNMVAFITLLLFVLLVAAGLRSRVVALLLAFINLGIVCYNHRIFRYVYIDNGEWKYDEKMPVPDVALPEGVSVADFEMWQMYDWHRYYFFLGLSTSGALLLLTQFGPGEIAIQKDEVLIVQSVKANK